MGKKRVMLPVEEVDIAAVKYQQQNISAPHLTGFALKLFVWLIEAPLIGSIIISVLKKQNNYTQLLRNTVIPENPMFRPEFPPQAPETDVAVLDENEEPVVRVEKALGYLSSYDPNQRCHEDSPPFLYWTIRDFAHAYRKKLATPSSVAEHIILIVEEYNNKKPPMPLLVLFNAEEVRKQAAASTQRFEEGKSLSILDGIFVAIKDDIDCYPYPSKSGTSWLHNTREVKKDAVCVSRLRSCGVILIGKANMHELGMGTTGNNPIHGTTRNPHSFDRYTGGSSSGPAALVASGLCSAALGTDGGGSVRIPSSLCGIIGLKTTYGRIDMKGSVCDCGTVEVVSPLAATVEDAMIVYAALAGSSFNDRISLRPSPICLPDLSTPNSSDVLRSMKLGKYSEWFNDVYSSEISTKCDDALNRLSEIFDCSTIEIVLPELHEMQAAHVVSIGSESLCALNPDCEDGRGTELSLDTRVSFALFRSFSAADYVAAQRLRRRIMYYYAEAFKKVDIIVTPTTGITAPKISSSSLKNGESNFEVTGYLMRFVLVGNLLGLPAVSVPIGHDKEGLPIGLQLIGRPWGEATILRVASAVEDTELPLIVENHEPFTTSVLGKELPIEEMCSAAVLDRSSGLTEAILPPTLNEERALVMYKPPDAHFASSLKINPKLVTCLKNYTFWPRNPNMLVEGECGEDMQSPTKKCLAMVPWVPSHATVTRQLMDVLATENELIEEPMEIEGEAHTFMEIEEENGESNNTGFGAQGSQQWQKHCMTPQLLQSNSTVMWS